MAQSATSNQSENLSPATKSAIRAADAARETQKGKTLKEVGPMAHVAEIVYHGEKLILPNGMGILDAVSLLLERQKYLEEPVHVIEEYDAFPWDGAHALDAVLTRKYGFAPAKATPGFWGPTPPQLHSIEVAPGEFKQVPWGAFTLPGVTGTINTQAAWSNDGRRIMFKVVAKILRKDEATVGTILAAVREELKTNSIYRGKAVKIRFLDEDGGRLAMPDPKFLNVNDVDEAMLVYPASVQNDIETNLFTPILRVRDLIHNGMTVKRGVLLGGIYGTGKTLAAKVASKYAVREGITYVYVPRADELSYAVEFAKQYMDPACVVFCEDIDRALNGERTVEMDDILNIIDGIDTKAANIITVLTTNDLDAINPAMLRPGRLDAVIEVLPPDAVAVEKLLRNYGGLAIPATADLSRVGEVMAGAIPAVVAEVVKRAKLAQLRRQNPGEHVREISAEALIEAAETMKRQLGLLNKTTPPPERNLENAFKGAVRDALNGHLGHIEKTARLTGEIHEAVAD